MVGNLHGGERRLHRGPIAALLAVSLCFLSTSTLSVAAELPGKGRTIQPAWNGILEDLFQTEVAMIGLERLGYDVRPAAELDITSMHIAVAQGDADFTAQHWEPLQSALFDKAGGEEKLERVGVILDDAVQGYLIDKKSADEYGINNIEQFKDPSIAKIFDTDGDGKADLAGCNPGWGCEAVIEHQLDAYGLRNTVTHNQGVYFALMADTIARFKNGQPVLYYTWSPLWVSATLVPGKDVTWLQVPFTSLPEGQSGNTKLPDGTNVGFTVNKIRVVANKHFLNENPAARRFFELLKISSDDINAENLLVYAGEKNPEDIRRHAEEWIAKNSENFNAWVDEAAKSAQ